MAKGDRKFAPLFSVWSVDAWPDDERGWVWNEKFKLFEFRTSSLNLKHAFLARLRHYLDKGVRKTGLNPLGKGWYYVEEDWDFTVINSRSDHRPWFACIRETP